MPSSVFGHETATEYGALDDGAITDAYPLQAHVLRAMARNANFLLNRADPVVSLVWPTEDNSEETSRVPVIYLLPMWQKFFSIPVIKPPGKSLYNLAAYVQIEGTNDVQFQVCSFERPFSAAKTTGEDNLIEETAISSTWQTLEQSAIPGSRTNRDRIELYARMLGAGTAMSGTYGSPSSGAIDAINKRWIYDGSATWDRDMAKRHMVRVTNGTNKLAADRLVIGTDGGNNTTTCTYLAVWPEYSDAEVLAIQQATTPEYEIYQGAQARFGSLHIVATKE